MATTIATRSPRAEGFLQQESRHWRDFFMRDGAMADRHNRCSVRVQIIQQHRDVRAFRLFDGGEQYGARLFFGQPPQFGQRRLVFRVLQFLTVARGEGVVAVVRVGVVPAAQFGRGRQCFQPDHLRHECLVHAARVKAVKEDGGFALLRLVVVDAGDAEGGHGWLRLRCCMAR